MTDLASVTLVTVDDVARARRRAARARCGWLYIAIDGRPMACELLPRDHVQGGMAPDHLFEPRSTGVGLAVTLLAVIDRVTAAGDAMLLAGGSRNAGEAGPEREARNRRRWYDASVSWGAVRRLAGPDR